MPPEVNSAAQTDGTTSAPATVAPAAEQAAAASESSTQETTELEVVHDGAPVPLEGETIEAQAEGETEGNKSGESADNTESNTDETKSEDQPREDKKRGRDARIQQLVENEKTYKDIIRNLNPDYDIEAALKGGRTEADARMDAFEHDKARTELAHEINQLNTNLQQQTEDLIEAYPFMDNENQNRTPEEKAQADMILDLWFEAAKPEFLTDKDGKMVVANGDPVFKSAGIGLYEFVDKIMNLAETRTKAASAAAEVQGQKNAEQKLAAVEIPTGSKPATVRSKSDASLSAAEYAEKHGLKVVNN